MPEGDSAHRAARTLHRALAGAELMRFDLRVPRHATADLTGETTDAVRAVGKHILHRIGAHTLHTHLKMEGAWHVYAPDERWRRPAFQARAIVGTAERTAVGFSLGIVELLPREREHEITDRLGPDPLGPDWDPDEAARRLAADTRPAHVALLDQRSVAGFGNEYANELLFLRGIDPRTPMTEVDVVALVGLGARTIRHNLDLPIRNFTGDTRRGRRTWVYGRTNQPCRRCGTAIREIALGANPQAQRRVFWCPACQR